MNREETFIHKVSTKLCIVLQQGIVNEISGEYDADLVDSCKQQCQEYLELVVEKRRDLLPSDVPLEDAREAYSRSYFDWQDFEETQKYVDWMVSRGILDGEGDYCT